MARLIRASRQFFGLDKMSEVLGIALIMWEVVAAVVVTVAVIGAAVSLVGA
jgi:hypothetical protein